MATTKAPYGDVTYADPGLQKDGQKRYPLDSEEHCRAAWSYINMPKNASQYSPENLAKVKSRIQAALTKYGVKVDANAQRNDLIEPVYFVRSYPLEDIHVQRTTDGRTVEAYAAVFDTAAEIRDPEGHYLEVIDPKAFNRVVDHVRPQGARRNWSVGVFYNHATTMHGTPSERGSVPIGTPMDIRPDSRGLLTVTRYNRTSLADEVLEAIREGAINGQSFTGRIVRSEPTLSGFQRRRGGYGPDAQGRLTTVRRTELGLQEYGPTPMPAYKEAGILSVRSLSALEEELAQQGTPSTSGPAADDRKRRHEAIAQRNRERGFVK